VTFKQSSHIMVKFIHILI